MSEGEVGEKPLRTQKSHALYLARYILSARPMCLFHKINHLIKAPLDTREARLRSDWQGVRVCPPPLFVHIRRYSSVVRVKQDMLTVDRVLSRKYVAAPKRQMDRSQNRYMWLGIKTGKTSLMECPSYKPDRTHESLKTPGVVTVNQLRNKSSRETISNTRIDIPYKSKS